MILIKLLQKLLLKNAVKVGSLQKYPDLYFFNVFHSERDEVYTGTSYNTFIFDNVGLIKFCECWCKHVKKYNKVVHNIRHWPPVFKSRPLRFVVFKILCKLNNSLVLRKNAE